MSLAGAHLSILSFLYIVHIFLVLLSRADALLIAIYMVILLHTIYVYLLINNNFIA
jgi:hypothetical protein